jgi:hypothetical protein
MRDPRVPFVVAPSEMTARNVSAIVEVAQVPGSKLIDFCEAREVPAELFVLLARRWRVPGGIVRRLAFVFPREAGDGLSRVLRRAARRRMGVRASSRR